MFTLCIVCLTLTLVTLSSSIGDKYNYESNIYFNYYKTKNVLTSRSNNSTENVVRQTGIDPNGKVNVIVHAYGEDCNQPWVTQMLCNFNTYRPGATFCMDYSFYSNYPTIGFNRNISYITKVFVDKIQQMEKQGFDLSQFLVFAFSAGSKIVIDGGAALGGRIGQIYSCEHPSAIYDGAQINDPKTSAIRVQGIHTSNALGTIKYNNHVDFILGHCGRYQDGKCGELSFSNHRMCPYFFNCAFKNAFRSVTPSTECRKSLKYNIKTNESCVMGWQSDDIEVPDGIYYANTTNLAPYNEFNEKCAASLPDLSPCCSACN